MTCFAWLSFVLAVVGCAEQPIKNPFAKEKPLPSQRARARPLPAFDDPEATSAVPRLTVNTETVEAAELWKGEKLKLADRARTLTESGYRQYVEERAAALINERIAEMLLYQVAATKLEPAMQPTLDRLVDEQIRKTITAEHNGIQRRFERYLESTGMTLADYRQRVRRDMISAHYLEIDVKPKVAEPTRAELVTYFEDNREAWRKTPRRSMSLIDVRIIDRLDDGASQPSREELAAAKDAARKRIEAAKDAISRGENFADVARKFSDGLNAQDGGAWGWISRDGVRERFLPAVDALEKLNANGVSDIIETSEGFFLVRCDEYEPGSEPDFQSVQPQLKDRYFRNHYNQLVDEKVRKLRERARVSPANLERFHLSVVAAVPQITPD